MAMVASNRQDTYTLQRHCDSYPDPCKYLQLQGDPNPLAPCKVRGLRPVYTLRFKRESGQIGDLQKLSNYA